MNAARRGASTASEDKPKTAFVSALRAARGTDFASGLRAVLDAPRRASARRAEEAVQQKTQATAEAATDALYERLHAEYIASDNARDASEIDVVWTCSRDTRLISIDVPGLQTFANIPAITIRRGRPKEHALVIDHAVANVEREAEAKALANSGIDLDDDHTVWPEGLQEDIDDAKADEVGWFTSRPEFKPLKAHRAEFEKTARRWFIVQDNEHIVPLHAGGESARRRFAEDYRSRVPEFSGGECIVCAVPGSPVAVILWSDNALTDSQVRQWSERAYGGERFEPVEFPWSVPAEVHRFYLGSAAPGRLPVASSLSAAKGAQPAVIKTGLSALDAQLRTGGLPMGARLCVSGPPGSCKTTLLLEIAEQALDQGSFIVWIAEDERPEQLTARRLQRRGLSPTEAAAVPIEDTAKLDRQPFHVCEGVDLEKAWEIAWHEAGGRPLLIVLDSIQKVTSVAGAGKGDRERIDATLAAIVRCQQEWPARVAFTSEVARGSGEAKGSVGLDYTATLHVGLRRNGEKVVATVRKNRHGSEKPFELKVNQDKQRMLSPGEAANGAAKRAVWGEIQRVLTEKGPLSRSKIEAWATGGAEVIRAVVRERTDVGDLVVDGQRYSLR